MEESGENSPSVSHLEGGDDVKDFIFEEGEFVCDDDEGHSFSETGDPMMGNTYRKRREEELVTERLLALSAAIPGLKKQQQEVESNICSSSKGTTTTCEVKSDDYHGTNDILPEVQARVSQNEVLVTIHCEKQKGTMLKILSQLENIHLSVVKSSVLQFGKSTIDIITIVAQMGDRYNITVDELVKTLRIAISTQ